MTSKCERFSANDLVYHSSEQYLILCLKLCNLIIKNKCDIKNLVEETNLNKTSLIASPDLYSTLLFSNLNETECTKYGHKESYKLSLFIFGILLCFIILILNGLTLITIIRSRRLHTITNILIANLSISDFLSGVSFLYPCVLNLLTINALETYNSNLYTLACNIRQYYYVCLSGYSPMITSMLSSMLTLTLLALEKYIAIVQPYLYKRFVHERKYLCYFCLFLTWSISIGVSLLPIMGWNEHHKYSSYRGFNCRHSQSMPCMFERIFTLSYILLFTGICCACAFTMLAIYSRIYIIARRHSKQIAKIHSILNKQHDEKQDKKPADNVNNINLTNNEEIIVVQPQSKSTPNLVVSLKVNRVNHFQIAASFHSFVSLETNKPNKLASNENIQVVNSESNKKFNSIDNLNANTQIITTTTTAQVAATTKSINRSMKAMKTLLILLLGFYLCWLPLIVYFLTFASKKYNNLTIYILMFVACCNAVIDPIVYAFRNREFCKALLLNFKREKK